ncbi:uncharacterized protein LOC131252837 [Magnolia sinica]|uniref:uncharacterized protein LOC131252837 n=1 Tax=Magnolia sinica TaxID=86752 RepID=UPI0026596CA0|nr:uncharacterized protein LOC131252837 [Magnolia sinica]
MILLWEKCLCMQSFLASKHNSASKPGSPQYLAVTTKILMQRNLASKSVRNLLRLKHAFYLHLAPCLPSTGLVHNRGCPSEALAFRGIVSISFSMLLTRKKKKKNIFCLLLMFLCFQRHIISILNQDCNYG